MEAFSVYIHIPYCLSKCAYCDFNSYAVASIPEKDYVAALLAEFDYRAGQPEWRDRSVQTIYFGGGTPSLFSPASIGRVISTICRRVPVHDAVEITLEGNPCSLSAEKLEGYVDAGVNRISIGAQSHSQTTLSVLGRMHTPAQVDAAYAAARNAGCNNISLDLMYGVPGQTLIALEEDLLALVNLEPEHISAYGLTVEKGTPFYAACKKGKFVLPEEDLLIEMMKTVESILAVHGLERYEISNYAKPHRAARHNLAYWNRCDYLGLGAGAHSFSKWVGTTGFGERWSNYALPGKYMQQAASKGQAESWRETLSAAGAIFEFFFLGLRKKIGVSLTEFEEIFQVTVEKVFPALLEVLITEGLLLREGGRLALTDRGLLVADSVFENFAAPEVNLDKIVKVRPAAPKISVLKQQFERAGNDF